MANEQQTRDAIERMALRVHKQAQRNGSTQTFEQQRARIVRVAERHDRNRKN